MSVPGDPHQLTGKQRIFVEEYVRCWNAREAVAITSPDADPKYYRRRYENFMSSPRVRRAIEDRVQDVVANLGITTEMVVSEIAAVAFANVSHFLTFDADDVTLKSLDEILDDPVSRKFVPAISSVKVTQGKFGSNIELKMHDKLNALDKLTRMMELINDKPTANDSASVELVTAAALLGKLSRLAPALGAGTHPEPVNTGGDNDPPQRLEVLGEGQSAPA